MNIDYDHSQNLHTLQGARAALPFIFSQFKPKSLLDVGCGVGTWLKAALEFGVSDVLGVDGVEIPAESMVAPFTLFSQHDLTRPWDLGRRFDAALCLEVAEHLDAQHGQLLISGLVKHSDFIVFSAACPGQVGQNHVNCQWPSAWQRLFNDQGYVCSDAIRWQIWENSVIEPWYRQNLFIARRDTTTAGNEPRLAPVVHPDTYETALKHASTGQFSKHLQEIEQGRMSVTWCWTLPFRATANKVLRRLR